MITLSEFLGTIPCAGNAAESVQIAIREAKRLEALDVPQVEAERKPLVDDDGDDLYVVWANGRCIDLSGHLGAAKAFAASQVDETGQPHTVCQVMAPESGECPTIPLATFTPERPHDWIIYRDSKSGEGSCFGLNGAAWFIDHKYHCVQRFDTEAAAQAYIDENDITDAYPWPVPKLTS